MSLAYFDLYSGAAGDMILAALLDAGLDLETLRDGLQALPLHGYRLLAEPVRKGAVGATSFHVEVDEPQAPRHLTDILSLIEQSTLPPAVKACAARIFTTLGQAEARVHRSSLEEVHFHEVGAVDSIIDIVGACLAFHLLGIEHIYSSPFPAAPGSHHMEHGWLPLPGPATLQIIADAAAPVVPAPPGISAELVTPTGAAILATLASFEQPPLLLRKVGYGAGDIDLPHPNVLRVWLGDLLPSREHDHTHHHAHGQADTGEEVVLLETNIDDMNPQVYGFLFDRLFEAGALDVYLTPITMKKSRPGTMLSVVCPVPETTHLQQIVLEETTTLGIRVQSVQRRVAGRSICIVDTPLGPVRIKVKQIDGRAVAAHPEYEDCAALAREHDRPLLDVWKMATCAANAALDHNSVQLEK